MKLKPLDKYTTEELNILLANLIVQEREIKKILRQQIKNSKKRRNNANKNN